MAASPFKTKKFKDLFKLWNNKLKKSGFDDAEDFNLPTPALKKWDNFYYKRINSTNFKARQQYFEDARSLLHTYEFKKLWHKKIWEMYADGMTVREISLRLKSPKRKKSQIWDIIAVIEKSIK